MKGRRTKLRDIVLHVDELAVIDQALWQYLQTVSGTDSTTAVKVLRTVRCASDGVPATKLRRQSFQGTKAFLDKYCRGDWR